MKSAVKRLYEQFHPSQYDLDIAINEQTMTFSGTVVVNGKKAGRPSKRITLHQKDLRIKSATIIHKDKKGHSHKEVARINTHNAYDEVRLHTSESLFAGDYSITIAFEGSITRAMNGIYPCTYEELGIKKQFIATQFESHHAREVFPCIDEPEAKAIFNLSLDTRKTIVVANTPIKEQSANSDRQLTSFEPTPIMSTYLLAFVVGDMDYKEATSMRGVLIRAYATPENVQFTDFALETAVRSIDYYEDFFGIPYPLAKCDIIALPDFASGAMENWGCITFREQCMLVDPENTSLPAKQYVAMVVAHELAHMWFGNLVTMRWWTDLWLNEGFATWVEYLATDALFPEWQMWIQFIANEQQQAMKLDSLENTHAIEVPVKHPDEIRTIFDAISYSKGASVIHQLYAYLGHESFKKGLQLYLTRHAYGNTDTPDLWQALSEVSSKDVKTFMHEWTSHPGYPIISVTQEDTSILLSQKRFYMDTPAQKAKDSVWQIPLLSDQLQHTEILTNSSSTIPNIAKNGLLLNKGRSGFYRVSYDQSSLDKLAEQLLNEKLSPLDRLGLLADLFEASKSGNTTTVSTLRFLEHYSDEQNAVVWSIIASVIGGIRLVMGSDELRDSISPFIIDLAEAEYKRLGWDKKAEDTYFDQLLRPTILGLLASADYPEVIIKCNKLFDATAETEDIEPDLRITTNQSDMKRSVDIDPDMRGVVFGTVARLGDVKTFDKLLSLYDETTSSEEKLTYCAALTDFRQPELIDRALGLIRTDSVRLQDVSYWLAYSFLNHHARPQTWNWLKENWEWMQTHLGNDLSFYRTPIYAARVHSDAAFRKEYVEFFTPKMSPGLERSYKQGLEMLTWHGAWQERDYTSVLQFFKDRQ